MIIGFILTTILLVLVAAVPGCPVQPVLPAGYEAYAPLSMLSSKLGVGTLSEITLGWLTQLSLVLAVGAFVCVLRDAWRGLVPLRLAVGLTIGLHLLTLCLPLLVSRDVFSYSIYGRIAAIYGQNPYVAMPSHFQSDLIYPLVAPMWQNTPPVYGPVFTRITALFARVAPDANQLVLAFKLLAVASSLATLAVLTWLVRRFDPKHAAFCVVLFGWNPAVVVHAVAGGHNDMLVALAIAGALLLVAQKREYAATAALTLGALVKITAAVPLFLLLVTVAARRSSAGRIRGVATHLAVAAALTLTLAIPYVQTTDPSLGLIELAGHEGHVSATRLLAQGLLDAFTYAGMPRVGELADGLVRLAFSVVLAAALFCIARELWRKGDTHHPMRQAAAWGWALLLLTLLGPVLFPWYIVWMLPLAFALPRVPRIVAVVLSGLLGISWVVAKPLHTVGFSSVALDSTRWIVDLGSLLLLPWLLAELQRRVRAGVLLEPDEP